MFNKPKRLRVAALMLCLLVISAACASGEPTSDEPQADGEVTKGGTITREVTSMDFTSGFDPSGEYLATSFGFFGQAMIRTLMNYRHVAGEEGNVVLPDLAAAEPEISEDGLTYTFEIKEGVKYGPPVDRDVVCDDVLYAFERIGTKSVGAQYGFYYSNTIEGLQDFIDGKADEISGITCTDEQTIEFQLTEPTGDFLYRLAMPATGPIPREVGECFEKAGEYGRYVISSSSYMLEGSEDLDISKGCKGMKPISGYDPSKELILVRNPNYDAETDSPELRSNNIDSFIYRINTNEDDIFRRVEEGDIEMAQTPTPQALKRFSTDPELKERLHVDSGDRTWYITMNLAVPPFDDINVRKAANLIMDKEALQRAWGGPVQGEIATHIVPDAMLNEELSDYDPYATPGSAGDEEAAKAAMAESKYDEDGDGVCDDPVCDEVVHFSRAESPWTEMIPVIEASFKKLGITLKTRELADAYPPIQDVSNLIPVASVPGWGKDYPDPYTFVGFLFDGRNILPEGNTNYALVGLTPDSAADLEKDGDFTFPVPGVLGSIPGVDADIDACQDLTEQADRTQCWIELDQKLMEEVVPWVPYLDANNITVTSEAVTKWEFDQMAGEASIVHMAVDPSKQ
ncbi:MAG TPA: ABC transporter substrate-binding protein [Actinomycetota bacterium]|nr:ABC transporter substrate-binding protein [Actinomycetota bacterium]